MIAKKSSKADLERKRFAFFQIGLIVAGSLTLAAFEYTTVQTEKQKVSLAENQGNTYVIEPVMMEDVVTTRPEPQRDNQQSAVQTLPDQEVTIVTRPINPNTIYTNQKVVITDPCLDCIDTEIKLEDPTGPIVDVPEIEPSFVGGEAALAEYIKAKVRYPEMLAQMGVGGVAYVEFVVNTDGSISNVVTKNDLHKDLKAEAERVINGMPAWIPGEQAGKKVRVRYVVPINFQVK